MKYSNQNSMLKGASIGIVFNFLIFPLVFAGEMQLSAPPPPSVVPEGVHVSEKLYKSSLSVAGVRSTGQDVIDQQMQALKSKGISMRKDRKVFVEIIGSGNADLLTDLDMSKLRALGVEIDRSVAGEKVLPDNSVVQLEPLSVAGHRGEAYVPLDKLEEVARSLPQGYRIQEVLPPDYDAVAGQGPVAINSDSYRDAGRNGTGLTVAVIDYGYSNLSAAQTSGDAPASYAQVNYTPDTFVGGGTHGTGCVEAMYDHAPGANWVIYKINSVSDMTAVVTHAIGAGVDVISHSLSRYNLGWNDNTGTACTEANRASNNGIVFFTSAGNRAQSHWQGAFADGDADDWHQWSGIDEVISITVAPNQGGNYYLSWSNSGTDLDFYLYNSDISAVIDSSTNTGAGVFEAFYYENTTASSQNLNIAVRRKSGSSNTQLEVFTHNANTWNEYAIAANSTTSPSNCSGTNVLSVGAVSHAAYGNPNGSNVIASYSSQGPSNSGMTLPDISGPTNTTGFTYPGGFGGTSSATPNAAGAAAAFWSADTNLVASGITWLIKEQADLWRDWGAAGNDNIYGKGGIQLIDYRFGTRWLADNYPGLTDDGTVPFETLQAAHNNTPNNGRILVFGDSYPATATLGATGNAMSVEMVPDSGTGAFGY
ncbi:MAG TPA: hypothetical protein EYP10_12850 [Armatimonadetes bacterium]|nr:hypothetical protein [Armatimonadota bacterium]